MATPHPIALLPMAQRTNFSYNSPASAAPTTTTHIEFICHVQGMTTSAMTMHFWIEQSRNSGSTWVPWYDSGTVPGGMTGDKSGVLGDEFLGLGKDMSPHELGPTIQYRMHLVQVGTYSFDANANVTF